MTRPARFTDDETHRLSAAFRGGRPLDCPRCASALDPRPVPPRRDVSYVRRRMWVTCPRCHCSIVLDERQPE